MRSIYTVASLLVCVQIVTMYPVEFTAYDDNEVDYPITNPDTFMPYTQFVPLWETPESSRMSKRQGDIKAQKRATLNQLLQRLIALYGDDDIIFSGRSSHLRFGAGGR